MPFLDRLSLKARYQRQEEKLRQRERELLHRERRTKQEIEKLRKLEAYERARKEKGIADKRARFIKKQEEVRVQCLRY